MNIEVKRGEVLALLGTNGAGKSTLLRAVSGLVLPDRGVVRMNGRTITLTDPQIRVAMGMTQIPGGEALFPNQTVAREPQGLEPAHRGSRRCRAERIEAALETFPVVRAGSKYRAGSLSGGEQQMLALSKAVMLDPEILLIDELSLGLAPLVVQQLLAVIERLKAQGLTMVIVEQSVNVALAVADRAVFMERGSRALRRPRAGAARARRPPARGVPLRRRCLTRCRSALLISEQIVFNGVVLGMLYALLALGVVLDLPRVGRHQLRAGRSSARSARRCSRCSTSTRASPST